MLRGRFTAISTFVKKNVLKSITSVIILKTGKEKQTRPKAILDTACFHLHAVSKIGKFIKSETRREVTRGWKNGQLLFHGVSVWNDAKSSR